MESFARLNQAERLCKKFPGLDWRLLRGADLQGPGGGHRPGRGEREGLRLLSEGEPAQAVGGGIDLADDLHAGNHAGQETLNILKEYIKRISDEMSLLDNKDKEEE